MIAIPALIALLVGTVLALGFGRCFVRSFATRRWARVEGVVIESGESRSESSDGRRMIKPIVRYRFHVRGREYFGDRLRMAERGDRWGRYAQQMRTAYPAGARVNVYFDPKRPNDNVLAPGVDWGCGFAMLFGLAVDAFGIFLMAGPHS